MSFLPRQRAVECRRSARLVTVVPSGLKIHQLCYNFLKWAKNNPEPGWCIYRPVHWVFYTEPQSWSSVLPPRAELPTLGRRGLEQLVLPAGAMLPGHNGRSLLIRCVPMASRREKCSGWGAATVPPGQMSPRTVVCKGVGKETPTPQAGLRDAGSCLARRR